MEEFNIQVIHCYNKQMYLLYQTTLNVNNDLNTIMKFFDRYVGKWSSDANKKKSCHISDKANIDSFKIL